MVRSVTRRLRWWCLTVALTGLLPLVTARAAGGGGGSAAPGPAPSGAGTAALTHGKLVAGAGGTYLPITPTDIPGGSDPRNPLGIPPQGPNPQGLSCPTTSLFHVGPGSPAPGGGVVAVIAIHPAFTSNSSGGYDGSRRAFRVRIAERDPRRRRPHCDSAGEPRDRRQCDRTCHRRDRIPAHTRAPGRTRSRWHRTAGVASARASRSAPHTSRVMRRHRLPPPGMLTTPPFPDRCVADRRADRGLDDRNRRHAARTGDDVAHVRAHSDVRVDGLRCSSATDSVARAQRRARRRVHAVPAVRRDRHPRTGDVELGRRHDHHRRGACRARLRRACRRTTRQRRRGPIRAR